MDEKKLPYTKFQTKTWKFNNFSRHFEFLSFTIKFEISDPKSSLIPSFRQTRENLIILAAILDLTFWICNFWHQIRNQQPQKLPYTKFQPNATKNRILATFIGFLAHCALGIKPLIVLGICLQSVRSSNYFVRYGPKQA